MNAIIKEVLEIRWDKRLTEARWKEVRIDLVALRNGLWWVERDEEGETAGSRKLMYSYRIE